MKSSLVCTSEGWAADIAGRLPLQSEEEVVGFLHIQWYLPYFAYGMKRGIYVSRKSRHGVPCWSNFFFFNGNESLNTG